MRLPSDFKRNYRYKSDPRKDRMSHIIGIILAAVALFLLWYLF